ncbi:MAG: glucosaminidase domain-containing protein [Saprospiraceae bacterium]|nr:glucosaminidase domain-containing protein [Saprospiraceae bacterium]
MAQLHNTHAFYGTQKPLDAPEDRQRTESTLWKLALLAAIAYLVWSDRPLVVFSDTAELGIGHSANPEQTEGSIAQKLGIKPSSSAAQVTLDAGEQGHAAFVMDPGFAKRNQIPVAEATAGNDKCQDYVDRFAPVAMAEMRKYGIPASITLAQALLESNAGESKLVKMANNHFGIKCTARHCKKGHCVNYADDTHKDFFVKFPNAWGSYRAHSQHLHGKSRYAFLFELSRSDYRGWAKGLQQAGYASDKKYAQKLIALIERLDLHRYDK